MAIIIIVTEYCKAVPVRDIKEGRGFLKGMGSDIEREEGDRG
jgi:hypothetical protein